MGLPVSYVFNHRETPNLISLNKYPLLQREFRSHTFDLNILIILFLTADIIYGR